MHATSSWCPHTQLRRQFALALPLWPAGNLSLHDVRVSQQQLQAKLDMLRNDPAQFIRQHGREFGLA